MEDEGGAAETAERLLSIIKKQAKWEERKCSNGYRVFRSDQGQIVFVQIHFICCKIILIFLI